MFKLRSKAQEPAHANALELRAMRTDDLDRVLKVERAANAFAWSRQVMSDCLRAGYDCRVGVLDGVIVLHAVMILTRETCEICNLSVHPGWQGRGYGRWLLAQLLATASARGVRDVYLEVRHSNARARALYDSVGFNQIGIRPEYYRTQKGREDAIVLGLTLQETAG